MAIDKQYPEFASIEEHIRRARLERSVAVANMIATGIAAVVEALRRLAPATSPAQEAPSPARKPLVVKARIATAART